MIRIIIINIFNVAKIMKLLQVHTEP